MQAPRDVTTTQAAGSLEAGLVGTLHIVHVPVLWLS
jgi:hypothetical protein